MWRCISYQNSFRWNCYIPEMHQTEKLTFLGISRYKFRLRFWICTEEFGFLDLVDFVIFSGISHIDVITLIRHTCMYVNTLSCVYVCGHFVICVCMWIHRHMCVYVCVCGHKQHYQWYHSYVCGHTHMCIHVDTLSHVYVWRHNPSCRPRTKKSHSKHHQILVLRIVSIVTVPHVRESRLYLHYWHNRSVSLPYHIANRLKTVLDKVLIFSCCTYSLSHLLVWGGIWK